MSFVLTECSCEVERVVANKNFNNISVKFLLVPLQHEGQQDYVTIILVLTSSKEHGCFLLS